LKNSIAATEQQLQEHRGRLKRNKKEHKAALAAIKKEGDKLANSLGTAGGNDERQRQRTLQLTQNIRQAEDAANDIALKINALGDIPVDETNKATEKRLVWKRERSNKEAVCTELENVKAETERQVRSVEGDITTAVQKRERLQQRQARLNEQYDRLIVANEEGYTAKQRKEQERLALEREKIRTQVSYRTNIENYERRANEINASTAQMMQTIHHLDALNHQQSQQPPSVPATPDGPLPGTNGMSPFARPFSSFTFPSFNANVGSTPGSLRGGRGRSSSMLSNISGFTDGFEDMATPSKNVLYNPFQDVGLLNGRKGSHGSGSLSSGTSSQSSSQRDPTSPLPNVKPVVRSPNGKAAGLKNLVIGRQKSG
jgi:hypothetical protein